MHIYMTICMCMYFFNTNLSPGLHLRLHAAEIQECKKSSSYQYIYTYAKEPQLIDMRIIYIYITLIQHVHNLFTWPHPSTVSFSRNSRI